MDFPFGWPWFADVWLLQKGAPLTSCCWCYSKELLLSLQLWHYIFNKLIFYRFLNCQTMMMRTILILIVIVIIIVINFIIIMNLLNRMHTWFSGAALLVEQARERLVPSRQTVTSVFQKQFTFCIFTFSWSFKIISLSTFHKKISVIIFIRFSRTLFNVIYLSLSPIVSHLQFTHLPLQCIVANISISSVHIHLEV